MSTVINDDTDAGCVNTDDEQGKRFESGWSAYLVAVYANTLFYYEKADELPRGVVPLAGCSVKAVDRIFRNSDAGSADGPAEDCGPCWKITSSAGRVLLFRSRSSDDRQLWIDRVNQANVEHPAYRRRLSGRRGSLDAGQGRRRRASSLALSSRLSQDESQRHASQQQHRYSDASAALLVGHEVSGLLRDAMLIVKRQKQEILELKRKLQELQEGKDQVSTGAAIASAGAAVKEGAAELVDPPTPAPVVAADDVDVDVDNDEDEDGVPAAASEVKRVDEGRRNNGSMDIEIDSIVLDDDEVVGAEVVAAHGSESESAARVTSPALADAEPEEDKPAADTLSPAPHSAPGQLEHTAFSESDSLFARATNAVADAAALSASVGAGGYTRSSHSSGSAETDYLQQQAMELAEIARSLQSSFRTDFTVG